MPIITPGGALAFTLPDPEAIKAKLPIPSVVVGDKLVMHHTHDVCKVLTNLGLNMKGWHPFETRYDAPKVKFTHALYPHARETARKMIMMERGFVLNDPRLGKTSSVITALHFLATHGHPGGALIVAPLTTLESVWVNEIMGMLLGVRVVVLHKKNHTGAKLVTYVRKQLQRGADYFIINPAGLKNPKILSLLVQARDKGIINKFVIDESTQYGNVSTANWKAANTFAKGMRWFWMLTGTPGGPLTVYGQAKMMNPNNVPERLEMWRLKTMTQVTEYKWVPMKDADDKIFAALQPAVRFKRSDVFKDMPEEIIIPVTIPLDPKAASLIKFLEEDGAAIVSGDQITPANAGVLAGKVLQISSGSLRMDNGSCKRVPIKDKVDWLKQIMSETPGKTLIFAHYQESIRHLNEVLNKDGIETDMVYGATKSSDRAEIFHRFQNGGSLQVLIAHPNTTAYGIELAAADTIVFWGAPQISPFLYAQAKGRLFSTQQKSDRPVIYQLSSTRTEEKMFRNLDNGASWETGVTDMFKEIVETGGSF